MKASKGLVNPKLLNEALHKKLKAASEPATASAGVTGVMMSQLWSSADASIQFDQKFNGSFSSCHVLVKGWLFK